MGQKYGSMGKNMESGRTSIWAKNSAGMYGYRVGGSVCVWV